MCPRGKGTVTPTLRALGGCPGASGLPSLPPEHTLQTSAPAGCWGSPSWSFLLLTGTVCLFITRSAHLGTLLDQSARASGLKSWLPGQADGGRAGSSGDSLGLGSAFLPSPSCEATPCDWPPGLPPQRGCVTSLVQEGGDGLGPGWGPTSKPGLPGPEKGL